MTADTVERALRLWQLGLSLFPVPRPRSDVDSGQPGDGKVPEIPWREYQNRRPTEADVINWFSNESNIAIVTGAVSRIVIVDADTDEALRWCTRHLPYTPWQTRTARGFHLWYLHPGQRVANRARIETRDGRLAVDLRGDGGYVIGPGSIHHTGVEYSEAGDWSVAREQLPRFQASWLAKPQPALTVPRFLVAPLAI